MHIRNDHPASRGATPPATRAPLPTLLIGWLPLLLGMLFLGGCGFATLDHLMAERNGEWVQVGGRLDVTREGKHIEAEPGALLKKGDIIETGPDTSAVISFMTSGKVILRPSTRIKILNPSLLEYFGELFVKVKGAFEIHYAYGTAGSKGTEYIVKVSRGDKVTVTVLEGAVILTSKTGAWRPVELGPREQGQMDGPRPPRSRRLGQKEFNETIDWVNEIEAASGADDIQIIVPDVVGMSRPDATRTLEQEHLRVGRIERLLTRKMAVGKVLRQVPRSNSRVPPGNPIDLAVEAQPTKVPNLKGLSQSAAKRKLTRKRLYLGRVEAVLGSGRVGTVLRQRPAAGSVVMTDSPVDVDILAESAIVPDVRGLSLTQARGRLHARELRAGNIEYRMSGQASVGEVLTQQPPPGKRVFAGSKVSLVVEADSVLVPQLVDLSRSQAEQVLRSGRLALGPVRERRVSGAKPGTVLDQSPSANNRVAPGTRVTLTVAAEVVVAPSLIGKSLDYARQILRNARLRVGRTEQRLDDRHPANTVLDQRPPAGRLLDPGSRVDLVVAQAGVRVPGVTRRSLGSAAKALSAAGLRYRTTEQPTNRYSPGTVMNQSPAAGTLVRRGASILLTVAREVPKCTVPRVVGNGYSAAMNRVRAAGLKPSIVGRTKPGYWVVRQSPTGGQLTCGGTVTLYTSPPIQ